MREPSSGACKLWKELQTRYPYSLEFEHSHGLGVVQLSDKPDDDVLDWLRPGSAEKARLVNYFSFLGKRLLELTELRRHIATLNQVVAERERQIVGLNNIAMEQIRIGEIERRKKEVESYKEEFRLSYLLQEKTQALDAFKQAHVEEIEANRQAYSQEIGVNLQAYAQELGASNRAHAQELEANLQAYEQALEANVQAYARELELIVNSLSMRITKPLRGMLNIVRRITRR
jgi:hypothetical protein